MFPYLLALLLINTLYSDGKIIINCNKMILRSDYFTNTYWAIRNFHIIFTQIQSKAWNCALIMMLIIKMC